VSEIPTYSVKRMVAGLWLVDEGGEALLLSTDADYARKVDAAQEQHAVLRALVLFGRWQWNSTEADRQENAVALRKALDAIGLQGPLASILPGIIFRAEQLVERLGERGTIGAQHEPSTSTQSTR
jgi:hypothetical protein